MNTEFKNKFSLNNEYKKLHSNIIKLETLLKDIPSKYPLVNRNEQCNNRFYRKYRKPVLPHKEYTFFNQITQENQNSILYAKERKESLIKALLQSGVSKIYINSFLQKQPNTVTVRNIHEQNLSMNLRKYKTIQERRKDVKYRLSILNELIKSYTAHVHARM